MFLKLIQLLRMGDIRIDHKKPLEGEELNFVLVSAFEASQNFSFLNAYRTGLSETELEKIVHKQWQIGDRDEALEELSNLIQQNQDKNLEIVYKAAGKLNHQAYLEDNLPEDKIAFEHYLVLCEALKKAIPYLIKANVLKSYEEITIHRDTAWHMARGAFLARCCHDLGYFTEIVLQSILIGFYKELKKNCKTWEAYTKSYILGRTLNGYNDYKDIQFLAKKLLNHRNSPLNQRVII